GSAVPSSRRRMTESDKTSQSTESAVRRSMVTVADGEPLCDRSQVKSCMDATALIPPARISFSGAGCCVIAEINVEPSMRVYQAAPCEQPDGKPSGMPAPSRRTTESGVAATKSSLLPREPGIGSVAKVTRIDSELLVPGRADRFRSDRFPGFHPVTGIGSHTAAHPPKQQESGSGAVEHDQLGRCHGADRAQRGQQEGPRDVETAHLHQRVTVPGERGGVTVLQAGGPHARLRLEAGLG